MRQVFKTPTGFVTGEGPLPLPLDDGVVVRVERSLISPGTETMGLGGTGPDRGAASSGPSVAEELRRRLALVEAGVASLRSRGVRETWRLTRQHLKLQGGQVSAEELAPEQLWATGYSASGVVIESGPARGLPSLGQRVACAGAGHANHAEYIAVPRRLCVPLPEALDFDAGAFVTLGAIAMHGVRRAEATLGERVVVVGLGLVGLLAAQIARAGGARVLGLEPSAERRAMALALGLEVLDAAALSDPVTAVRAWSDGDGADRVLLCLASASSEPTNNALKMCRKKGRVVLIGVSGMQLERAAMFPGEVDFVISTSYGPGRYDPSYEQRGVDYPLGYVRWTEQRNMSEFLRLVASGAVSLGPLVSSHVDVSDAPSAYERLRAAEPRPVGVLIDYPARPEAPLGAYPGARLAPLTPRPEQARSPRTGEGPIRLGIIGAGAFVHGIHAPALRALEGRFELHAVANQSLASAERAARALGPQVEPHASATSLLADPSIELVLIGTRHDSHPELCEAALQAGKHVFVEKPLAIDRAGLQRLEGRYREHPDQLLCVGFNRRHAPTSRRLKEQLGPDARPLLVYRVNAGAIAAEHWIQDPVLGGGRVIGEACHMLDLFAYLSDDAELAALEVTGDGGPLRDSFVATLRYRGGGAATLVYTSRGEPGLPKERLELFDDGRAFVLDDFRSLSAHGGEGLAGKAQDKGFAQQWLEVAAALRGQAHRLPSPERCFEVTELSFCIEERLRGAPPPAAQ